MRNIFLFLSVFFNFFLYACTVFWIVCYSWLCWVSVAVQAFLTCSEQGLPSGCGAGASHCSGSLCERWLPAVLAAGCSLWGSLAPRSTGFVAVVQGLTCLAACIFQDEGLNSRLLCLQLIFTTEQPRKPSPSSLFQSRLIVTRSFTLWLNLCLDILSVVIKSEIISLVFFLLPHC